MNRAHSAEESLGSIKRVQDSGWENITIDLIYGTPTLSDTEWQNNLQTAINQDVPHISAYALTVEENTALHHFIEHKKCAPVEGKKCKAVHTTDGNFTKIRLHSIRNIQFCTRRILFPAQQQLLERRKIPWDWPFSTLF